MKESEIHADKWKKPVWFQVKHKLKKGQTVEMVKDQ